ncbi:hypothetical protein DOTSEDRAFT_42466 [Dothistroma septosporum NZE10]|uniref:Uncharacterized protein n=1 Tax=Dothistroma septosporum (strain NZE10 / CBS 128990) TaxID=675120 RepID=N1PZ00_DOTSN|nr:hypothetical protein DOTSEDRAFT_42466 [Dothistroma septosporum NZE10]
MAAGDVFVIDSCDELSFFANAVDLACFLSTNPVLPSRIEASQGPVAGLSMCRAKIRLAMCFVHLLTSSRSLHVSDPFASHCLLLRLELYKALPSMISASESS